MFKLFKFYIFIKWAFEMRKGVKCVIMGLAPPFLKVENNF